MKCASQISIEKRRTGATSSLCFSNSLSTWHVFLLLCWRMHYARFFKKINGFTNIILFFCCVVVLSLPFSWILISIEALRKCIFRNEIREGFYFAKSCDYFSNIHFTSVSSLEKFYLYMYENKWEVCGVENFLFVKVFLPGRVETPAGWKQKS